MCNNNNNIHLLWTVAFRPSRKGTAAARLSSSFYMISGPSLTMVFRANRLYPRLWSAGNLHMKTILKRFPTINGN